MNGPTSGLPVKPLSAWHLIVLEGVFHGDAGAWVDYLFQFGSARQRAEDLPVAMRMLEEQHYTLQKRAMVC